MAFRPAMPVMSMRWVGLRGQASSGRKASYHQRYASFAIGRHEQVDSHVEGFGAGVGDGVHGSALRHPGSGVLDGGDNADIGAATTQIAAHEFADRGAASRLAAADAGDGRHDLVGGAVAALEGVVVDEGCLHGVQGVALGEAFDRGDGAALDLGGESQAGDDGAGAALAVIAAFFRAREPEPLAQEVKERGAGVDLQGKISLVAERLSGNGVPVSIDARGSCAAPGRLRGTMVAAATPDVVPRTVRRVTSGFGPAVKGSSVIGFSSCA
jgi:hypothetical protein